MQKRKSRFLTRDNILIIWAKKLKDIQEKTKENIQYFSDKDEEIKKFENLRKSRF